MAMAALIEPVHVVGGGYTSIHGYHPGAAEL
jgi:hypothetical protein